MRLLARKIAPALLLSFLITAPALAQSHSDDNPYSNGKPLPEPTIVQMSDVPGVSTVLQHAVTHSYPGKQGTDPVKLLTEYIDEYTAWKDLANKNKELILKYFEIGHPEVLKAIERAVKAGVQVTIITDINQSKIGTAGNNAGTDFENAKYKNSPPAKVMQYLVDQLGFKFKLEEGRNTVMSGVLLNDPSNDNENDLMHDKVAVGKGFHRSLNGSFNPNDGETQSQDGKSFGGRYNSLYVLKNAKMAAYEYDYARAEAEEYNKRSDKGVERPPMRFVFNDGTIYEFGFTAKVYNLNDRITKLFMDATEHPDQHAIEEVVYSDFVLTETNEVEALRKLMDAQKDFKVFGVFDQQFIWTDGYGQAGMLVGYLGMRPMGKSIFPFKSEYEPRLELYGYQRLLDGVKKINLNGEAPVDVHLWHDKTTVVKVKEKNPATGQQESYTYVFTRSFNNSNHFQSIESQAMIKFKTGDPLAIEIENGIKEVARSEKDFAIDLTKAIVRDFMAKFTEHTPYDFDVQKEVVPLIDALTNRQYDKVTALLSAMAAKDTHHEKEPNVAAIADLTTKFVGFLKWYDDQRKTTYPKDVKDPKADWSKTWNQMTYKKAVNVGVGLTSGRPLSLKSALSILFYNPNSTPEEREALMKKAWVDGLKLPEKDFPVYTPNGNNHNGDQNAANGKGRAEDEGGKPTDKEEKVLPFPGDRKLNPDCGPNTMNF